MKIIDILNTKVDPLLAFYTAGIFIFIAIVIFVYPTLKHKSK